MKISIRHLHSPRRRLFPMLCALMLLLLPALQGCSSKKKVADTVTEQPQTPTNPLPGRLASVCRDLQGWDCIKIPLSVKITEPMRLSLSGSAVMERDRSVSISLRFMGMMEVATITITQDSVMVVDKYHKLYFREATDALLGGFPVTVANLQDLLLGRPFAPGQPSLAAASPTLKTTAADGWCATTKPYASWSCAFTFAADDALSSLQLLRSAAPVASITYPEGQVATQAGPIATKAVVNVPSRKPVEATLAWRADRAAFSGVSRPATPSLKGYRRVTLAQIVELVNNLNL